MKNKTNHQANHKATRHHAGNCINSLAPSVWTTNCFLQKKKKKILEWWHDQTTPLIKSCWFAHIWAYMQWILTQTQSIHDHQTSDNTESGFTHTRPMFSFIKKEFLANHDSNVCLSGSTGKDLNSWNPVRSSFENSIFYARICYVKQSGMIYGSDLFLKKKKKKKKRSL
jgi:hypothetical protein